MIILVCSLLTAQEYDIIYAINFFDGVSYNSTIVPYSVPEIYIQADHVNVFVVRETVIYYWPLTSEFKADWASRNIALPGILCINDRNGNISRVEPQRYIIQYDMKDIPGTIGVYWETEADSRYSAFVSAQRSYSESIYAYSEALRLYDQTITKYLQNPPEKPEIFPARPLPPADFTVISTDINIGFPVELPQGSYSIYFENPDGKVIPKTRKQLKVFTAREETKGFQVFEEGRWTVPSNFPDSKMYLFTVPGGCLYLQPFNYLHYRGSLYNLMMNPQNRYNMSESSIWIPVSLIKEARALSIEEQNLILQGYKVTQLAGSKLGYIINPLNFGDPDASFSAYKFTVAASSEGKTFHIGQSSAITVLRVFRGVEFVLVFASLVPLILFSIVSMFRRSFRYKEKIKASNRRLK
jgi:hypothetical protein